MFTHILCSLTKEEALDQEIKYIKVLGFNKKGLRQGEALFSICKNFVTYKQFLIFTGLTKKGRSK